VRERARICGLPIARFIREVSLGAVPKERRHLPSMSSSGSSPGSATT
jgi:hypothetical protein